MAVARGRRAVLPRLWLMTDSTRMRDPASIAESLPPGSGLILRHRDAAIRRHWAERVRPVCLRKRLVMLVAGDWRLAAALRCEGVHLSEQTVAAGPAPGLRLWRRMRPALLTAAAHSQRAVQRAARLGADAVFLAPVLATPSHPKARILGRVGTAAIVSRTPVRILALGGIGPRQFAQLNGIAVYGVAGVSFATGN